MEIVGGSVARAPDLVVVKRPLQLVQTCCSQFILL